ncbi:glutaredoxin 3 [Parvularcula sp. IMCC14364]|uniref:glutaredoxin 3 n=1 Tax=Parvularcula sp. IMCC14364 TaxID=3067902 RepID=UPI002740482A|nr:glutaredoxin 3 [Parvularcula sp. IMCC14364]
MVTVDIYTRPFCSYCQRALKLLHEKQADVNEINAGMDKSRRAEMIQRANGASTFPQIFIGDLHIGGSDDLHALERAGKLDPLLQGDTA